MRVRRSCVRYPPTPSAAPRSRASARMYVPRPQSTRSRTIGQELDRVTTERPEALALVSRHQGVRLTYGQLHAQVEQCARAFLALAKADQVTLETVTLG